MDTFITRHSRFYLVLSCRANFANGIYERNIKGQLSLPLSHLNLFEVSFNKIRLKRFSSINYIRFAPQNIDISHRCTLPVELNQLRKNALLYPMQKQFNLFFLFLSTPAQFFEKKIARIEPIVRASR